MDGLAAATSGPDSHTVACNGLEVELKDAVAGFVFVSGGEEYSDRNGHICKIIARAEPDGEDLGPAFRVRFGDGYVTRVYGEELQPWYPT